MANDTLSTSVWTRLLLTSQNGKDLSVVKYSILHVILVVLKKQTVGLSCKWQGVLFDILSFNLSALAKLSYYAAKWEILGADN